MSKRILQLPALIANQIAAGEVIERPASVVKELLENSLDAGATQINIDIAYGGLNQIKISDNGVGIVAEDLPLAIAAHATSKIRRLDDLYAISSMGFRGEALASIASIAKLAISSKPAEQEHAMMLTSQGAQLELAPCARNTGTTIDVRDLFFNAPVRKRFLKTERLEFQAIETVVRRFALSAPQIALTLTHNNKLMFSLPSALNAQAKQNRMAKILGSSFMKSAVFLDVEQGAMRIHGWISGKEYQRSQNDRQWVYINQRMVKDKLIHHAIKQAYEGLLHPGRFPSCLLYFTLNTNEIDVNVHPTKHEVRFQQPRLVHDFFITQLAKALAIETPQEDKQHYLSEPTPQFLPTIVPLQKNLSLPQLTSGSISRLSNYEEIPWTPLNRQFSLLWLGQQPYLVDIPALYRAWLSQHLKLASYPLANRPLLVAVRYPLSKPLKKVANLPLILADLGIHIEVQEETILIRSIPVTTPYLDLKFFFQQLDQLTTFNRKELTEQLIGAQIVEAGQFNQEERMALSQLLLTSHQGQLPDFAAYKPFTLEDCRMLLDA
ncbi:DNA mismatch repair endonuclease MutL [Legionella sp. km772]|uniref:DNA mismatch repair endonuclease MutL n=1 Tax=Legionella sp. km772 TaxID=2498111 RepID=UPI000F8ECE2C|nr:DNA mismatch repair endonuclease MutL [Legionella sp. km772]RUR12544.1 DNA mismatch repair endonuclease MutL [Legionella sp. km772]